MTAIRLFTIPRGLLGFLYVPLITVLCGVAVIILGSFRLWDAQTWCMWAWCRAVCWFYGARVVAKGFENIPAGGAIFAFNHQSNFDIPTLTGSTRARLRYGAKAELFKIPVFGQAIAAAGCLRIARERRAEVMQIYREAASRFQEGFYFALAPEGTRQSQPIIAPFKRGPFIFAASSGVPILPIVIEGADRVLPKGHLIPNVDHFTQTIQLEVLPPVHAKQKPTVIGEAMPDDVIADLIERTRSAMIAKFNALQMLARNG